MLLFQVHLPAAPVMIQANCWWQ